MRALFLFLLICFLSTALSAQKVSSGKLEQDETWEGLVRITGDIIVPKGVTLTIKPGCRVRMDARADDRASGKAPERIEIIVFGDLIAKGVPGMGRIMFSSDAGTKAMMNDWYGIIFKNRSSNSIMQNCLIEYAYKGITCYGSAPMILDSEVRFNQYAGISSEIRATPIIRNTLLTGNDFGGLICELASNPVVEKSIITQNTNGIIIFDQSRPDLGSTAAENGGSVGENLIFNNFESNIYNHSGNEILAQNNLWNTRSEDEIEQTLFHKSDNNTKGEVIFLPVSGESTVRRSEQIRQTFADVESAGELAAQDNPEAVDRKSASATRRKEDLEAEAEATGADANLVLPPAEIRKTTAMSNQIPVSSRDDAAPVINADIEEATRPVPAKQETLIVYRDRPAAPVTPAVTVPNEPIIEALLDGGKRQYIKRVKPNYPNIFKKTRNEGKVFMEVVVDKTGQVKDFRILRSDDELFSQAATDAVKGFLYKPGTFKGTAVSFKVVEPFYFKLKN